MDFNNVKLFHDLKEYFKYCEHIGSDKYSGCKAYLNGVLVAEYKKNKNN